MPQINGEDFLQLDIGRLGAAASTPDEPLLINTYAQPARKTDVNSTYRNVLEMHKNVIIGGATANDDDVLRVQVAVTTRHRSFTSADVQRAMILSTWLFTNPTTGLPNVDLWLRGVRNFS